jgi:Flp pilus assembly pilin Flp
MHGRHRLKSRRGATSSLEYALIGALVSIGFLAGLLVLSENVGNVYNFIGDSVTGALIYNPSSDSMDQGNGPQSPVPSGSGGSSGGSYSSN